MIYHIASAADWEQGKRNGEYTTSTRGRSLAEQGFIHCSDAAQVAQHDHVPGEQAPYPHIYGPLNPDAVTAVLPFRPGPDGAFTFTP